MLSLSFVFTQKILAAFKNTSSDVGAQLGWWAVLFKIILNHKTFVVRLHCKQRVLLNFEGMEKDPRVRMLPGILKVT